MFFMLGIVGGNLPQNIQQQNVGNQPNIQQQNVGNQPVNQVQPHVPNPVAVLNQSQQRFPNVPVEVLKGRAVFQSTPQAVLNSVEQVRNAAPPPGFVPIRVGDGDKTRVAFMPTAGVGGPNQAGKIQTYVHEGKEIYDRIMAGDFPQTPSKHDVTRVMWYLQALGSAKAAESSGNPAVQAGGTAGTTPPAPFAEGSFLVEDPDGRLQSFLERANSYGRSSSHMHEYQDIGPDFSPRGVDIRNTETPNERKTLMFARLPRDHEVPDGGPKGTGDRRMLFIKMEPHGCRGFTSRGSGTPRAPGEAPSKWKGFKRFFLNVKDTIMHGLGFARSLGQKLGIVALDGQNNRERIPSDVKNAWKGMLDSLDDFEFPGVDAEVAAAAIRNIREALENGNPLGDGNGIKTMLANLRNARAVFNGQQHPVMVAAQELGQALVDLETLLTAHGDHSDLRIGNEIILTREDMNLGTGAHIGIWRGDTVLSASNAMSREACDVFEAGLRYSMENLDNRNLVQSFELDSHRSVLNIGHQDNMQEIRNNTNAAKDAILQLTGGNQRTANAIMTIANQSMLADITSEMARHSLNTSNLPVTPGQAGQYSISRLPDGPDGSERYVLVATSVTHPDVLASMSEGALGVDPDQSIIETQTQIMLTVAPNGKITPELVAPPSYNYHLVPANA